MGAFWGPWQPRHPPWIGQTSGLIGQGAPPLATPPGPTVPDPLALDKNKRT